MLFSQVILCEHFFTLYETSLSGANIPAPQCSDVSLLIKFHFVQYRCVEATVCHVFPQQLLASLLLCFIVLLEQDEPYLKSTAQFLSSVLNQLKILHAEVIPRITVVRVSKITTVL